MTDWLERLCYISPAWLQQIGVNIYGWYWGQRRLGSAFEKTWRGYVVRESRCTDRMHDFIENLLRTQVQRAYRELPYYRQAFRGRAEPDFHVT
jgi:hypothetical protein